LARHRRRARPLWRCPHQCRELTSVCSTTCCMQCFLTEQMDYRSNCINKTASFTYSDTLCANWCVNKTYRERQSVRSSTCVAFLLSRVLRPRKPSRGAPLLRALTPAFLNYCRHFGDFRADGLVLFFQRLV